MRIPTREAGGSERADAAMTPMIDVVFLLLIFFLWTASFQIVERRLPSHLTASSPPGQGTPLEQEDFEQVVIKIRGAAGRVTWLMNDQPVASLAELQQRLAQLAAIKADLPVLLDPAEEIAFGDVIDVYDTVYRVGLANIQFTTRAELLGR